MCWATCGRPPPIQQWALVLAITGDHEETNRAIEAGVADTGNEGAGAATRAAREPAPGQRRRDQHRIQDLPRRNRCSSGSTSTTPTSRPSMAIGSRKAEECARSRVPGGPPLLSPGGHRCDDHLDGDPARIRPVVAGIAPSLRSSSRSRASLPSAGGGGDRRRRTRGSRLKAIGGSTPPSLSPPSRHGLSVYESYIARRQGPRPLWIAGRHQGDDGRVPGRPAETAVRPHRPVPAPPASDRASGFGFRRRSLSRSASTSKRPSGCWPKIGTHARRPCSPTHFPQDVAERARSWQRVARHFVDGRRDLAGDALDSARSLRAR